MVPAPLPGCATFLWWAGSGGVTPGYGPAALRAGLVWPREGTRGCGDSAVPSGLVGFFGGNPSGPGRTGGKRWAIFGSPFGTGEILRDWRNPSGLEGLACWRVRPRGGRLRSSGSSGWVGGVNETAFFLAFGADAPLFKRLIFPKMETNLPADEPTPPSPTEPTTGPAHSARPPEGSAPEGEIHETVSVPESAEPEETSEVAATEPAAVTGPGEPGALDELGQLAEASQKVRLSPGDEERMGTLLKEALLGGRAGVARAIEALPKVPWIVGVRAVEAVWPELTAGFRTQLLAGLAKEETDASRRIRLSLARALFKIDVAVALKVAAGVARELPDETTGTITPKQAQIFANVFIGRGKPWLAQLSLAELKPADGDALAHCAVLAVFALPHPPVTQLGVLKWVREQERLGKLNPTALEAVKKGVTRWSAKWQGALRKEVSDLPEEILAILKPVAGRAASPEAETAANEGGEGVERVEGAEEGAASAGGDEAAVDEGDEEDEDEDEGEDEDEEDEDEEEGDDVRKQRPVYEPRPQKPAAERPVYTPRNAGGVPKNFNLNEALRHIDGYVQSLRSELSAAQGKLRGREERRGPEKSGPILQGEPTLDELARLNQQLEARNTELQERINELTQHSEDVAVSTGALTGEPVSDAAAQLRTLLALKLKEDFADFLALEKESNDLVVQQHYKSLLRHVFEVLQQLDVPLKAE